MVLVDLARFCRAYHTIHVENDTHGSALLEGRRQVYLRIAEYMNINPRDLLEAVKRGEEREAEID